MISLLPILNNFTRCSCVFVINFEEVNAGWIPLYLAEKCFFLMSEERNLQMFYHPSRQLHDQSQQ